MSPWPRAVRAARVSSGKSVAGERADDHPRRVADHIAGPALDVGRRPGLGERVDRHDPPVALVVEREARRALGRLPVDREAELLEPGHERVAILGRRAADEHDVGVGIDLAQGAGAVPDHAAGTLGRAGDDVQHEVPDDGRAWHQALHAAATASSSVTCTDSET